MFALISICSPLFRFSAGNGSALRFCDSCVILLRRLIYRERWSAVGFGLLFGGAASADDVGGVEFCGPRESPAAAAPVSEIPGDRHRNQTHPRRSFPAGNYMIKPALDLDPQPSRHIRGNSTSKGRISQNRRPAPDFTTV